jgi:ABC-type Co2+ transport system permease subunit
MVGVHVVIGIGEAVITAAALAFIRVTRADLLRAGRTVAPRGA